VTTTHALTTPTISVDSTRHTNPAAQRKTLRVPARVTDFIAGTDCGQQILHSEGGAVPNEDRVRIAAYRMVFDTTPRTDGSRHVARLTRDHLDALREITATLEDVSLDNAGSCAHARADLNAARAMLRGIDNLEAELGVYPAWFTPSRVTALDDAAVHLAPHYRPSDCEVGPHGERAQSWQGTTVFDAQTGHLQDINTQCPLTLTALYRTTAGDWWVQYADLFGGGRPSWAPLATDAALIWLRTNNFHDIADHDFATGPATRAR
jgi:hypothetical protein